MVKKFIAALLIIILPVSTSLVCAANPVDELDNRGETENLAGVTWDQINEMSQNAPNSLSPIQGLVLWMFMILAFLKLAQKMDSLLQSLGINVTQTGGRALGDLIMAGMALKHIGSAVSKGMGMFGLGGGSGGGTSGTGSGTSTGSTGGTGPAPIPTGSTGSGPAPAGGSSTGSIPGGGASPGSIPPGGTPGSGASPGSTPSSDTSPNNPSSAGDTTSAESTGNPSSNRGPISRAAGWMREDGFAQGAIKAGAKGGLIGVGAYAAKTGFSKIGAAASARYNDDGISSDTYGEVPNDDNESNNPQGANNNANPEEYQPTKPLDGMEGQVPIPTAFNSEDYQDTNPTDNPDESDSDYSYFNDEEYKDSGLYDATAYAQPIPVSMGENGVDAESETSEPASSGLPADVNSAAWQDTVPAGGTDSTPPIPATVNNEGWNNSNPQPFAATAIGADSGTGATPQPPSALPPISSTQQGSGESALQPTVTALNNAVSESSQVQQSAAASVQDAGSVEVEGVNIQSEAASVMRQGTSAEGKSSGGSSADSSDSAVVVNDSSSHEGTSEHGSPQSAPMPMQNQAIPGYLPQNSALPSVAHDTSHGYGDNIGAGLSVSDSAQQAQFQSSNNAINADVNAPIPQSVAAFSPQAPNVSETISTVLPSAAQEHHAPSIQNNTTVQPQTTQINNFTNPDAPKPAQFAPQPAAHVVHVETQGHGTQPASLKKYSKVKSTVKK